MSVTARVSHAEASNFQQMTFSNLILMTWDAGGKRKRTEGQYSACLQGEERPRSRPLNKGKNDCFGNATQQLSRFCRPLGILRPSNYTHLLISGSFLQGMNIKSGVETLLIDIVFLCQKEEKTHKSYTIDYGLQIIYC